MNIKEIIEKHTDEDGKINQEEFEKELKEEQAKAYVPKEDFNSKNKELKSANETLEQLKKDNKNVETLQSQIKAHETKVTELQEELADERKTFAIKEALQTAGATDVDYMMYKLGDVEVDDEGNVKDLENKVKSLQEENKDFFKVKKATKDDGNGGYRVIDNKLDDGNATPLTKKDIYEKYPNDKEKRIELIQKLEEE
jgi:uncharacterized protein (DUF3084 family)